MMNAWLVKVYRLKWNDRNEDSWIFKLITLLTISLYTKIFWIEKWVDDEWLKVLIEALSLRETQDRPPLSDQQQNAQPTKNDTRKTSSAAVDQNHISPRERGMVSC